MQMTPDEIVVRYRQAKKKSEQLKILADLNACTVSQIIDVLCEHGGYDPRSFARQKNKLNIPTAEKKISYKKPEIIPEPPKTIALPEAMAAIRAELDDINRQQYELDMRKADLYKQLWDTLGEVER